MITYKLTYECAGAEKTLHFKSSYSKETDWEREKLYENAEKFTKAREYGNEIMLLKIDAIAGERTQWQTGKGRTLAEIRGL